MTAKSTIAMSTTAKMTQVTGDPVIKHGADSVTPFTPEAVALILYVRVDR